MGKSTEYLKFYSKDNEEILFPLARIEGQKPGPHVVITAGIHGCEYPGIAAAIELFKTLDDNICGTVSIVTITSVAAFESRTPFVCPKDGKNPNRFFPGDKNGTYTQAQTYYLLNNIIKGADYYIDLHGGDLVEALEPFSICHSGAGEDIDRKSFEIAYYYGLPNIVKTTWDGEWPDSGTTYANACRNGVPAAIVEVGGIGQMDRPSVEKHLAGLKNVLKHVGVLEGEPVEPEVQIYSGFKWIYTPWKGIFYCQTQVGNYVEKGDLLAYIEDYFGNRVGDIISPVDGKVVFLETTPAMSENSLLFGIAYIE